MTNIAARSFLRKLESAQGSQVNEEKPRPGPLMVSSVSYCLCETSAPP
ncbi:uncharacterized protein METZ01_LOCUS44914 [marine metagenome]|uniref:Uncharacterized protein n=1 Tax=marine metagenome TaxID=408172 RepID=A0A381RJQ1_9ZZZZ